MNGGLALAFVATAGLMLAYLPSEQDPNLLMIAVLVMLYATVSKITFEVGNGWVVPEQLVFVPLLFMVPLPIVPFVVAAGFIASELPDYIRGRVHVDRALSCVCDCWFSIGPVLVLALSQSAQAPSLAHAEIYVLAFAAQIAAGTVASVISETRAYAVPAVESLRSALWSSRIDAVLAPVGLMVAIQAYERPGALVAIVPLVWLLYVFSQERAERHAASMELNQAYKGTVMLLSDVVEADDNYTADHCRSVVELVMEVADAMKIPGAARQELEFAALLHDVGKIAIPKEILNKPAKLTDDEFELIKTHTIEGQLLLDRVGGLLARVGTIVRSCHERWDGNGYPDGLAGEQIPLAARIVFCCDAYNAMTTDRAYREAMSQADALTEMRVNSGTQFDPKVVDALEHTLLGKVAYPRLAHISPSEAVAAAISAGRHDRVAVTAAATHGASAS